MEYRKYLKSFLDKNYYILPVTTQFLGTINAVLLTPVIFNSNLNSTLTGIVGGIFINVITSVSLSTATLLLLKE